MGADADKAVPTALRIVLVEDSPADAELVLRALRGLARPLEHVRVASEATLRQALADCRPDVVLSDFAMPGFDGPQSLRICGEVAPDVPFLFVSGTIGEERAIDALQRGAADYVHKDNLRRLPSAVTRALDLAAERREHQRIEQALIESEERFRSIVENSQDWIWESDLETRMTYCNGAVTRMLGYRPGELLGTLAAELMLPEDRAAVHERFPSLIAAGNGWRNWRLRWCHRDGGIRTLDSTALPRLDADGQLIGYRGVNQDVTEHLRQEARIGQLARIHAVLSEVSNAVLRATDRDRLLLDVCRVAVEHGGFTAAGIAVRGAEDTLRVVARFGKPAVLDVVAPLAPFPIDDPAICRRHPGIVAFRENRRIAIEDLGHAEVHAEVGAPMLALGIHSQVGLPIGAGPWGLLALYSDTVREYDDEELALLQRLTSEIDYAVDFIAKGERLEFLAYRNPVRGLYNRPGFHPPLQARLRQAPMTLALLDIERFAAINDSHGRGYGDALLDQVGQRLRALAGAGALVAHLEADAFALAYRASGTVEHERERLEALVEAFQREPFPIGGSEIRIDLSASLALGPEHGEDAETLENNAMAAMVEGRKRGLRVHAFNEDLRGRAARRLALELDLRKAIEREEFELFYQPKFDAARQRLVGAEGLLRWRHPQRGLVSPGDFIPLLEESTLIVPVGQWVMREALRTALAWREHDAGIRIAVNVSARELRHSPFLADCRALLGPHEHDQPLDIEVTESLLMDDMEMSMRVLEGLRELGCKVSIDDFGTGYSSLNYLARLPVDEIKIDQSFTALLTESPETMALVTHIIGLAHALSLRVVAEGVEDEGQAQLLRLLRCDVLQGYLLGRPMPAAEFEQRLLRPAPAMA